MNSTWLITTELANQHARKVLFTCVIYSSCCFNDQWTTWLNISVTKGSSSASNVNNCYTFHDVASTWNEARDACRDMGAHLVTMETTDEWNKVKGLIKEKVKEVDSFYHYYIGLSRKGGMWKWTEGESPDATVAQDDSRWKTGEPSFNRDPREKCVEIWYPTTGLKGINDVQCDRTYKELGRTQTRGYICERY